MKINNTLRNIIGRLIGLAGKEMIKRVGRNFLKAGFDITAEQGIILIRLDEQEGVNQQTLTDFFYCEKTAMTRWIDSLESKKLLVRVPDKVDRRQNMIFLTKEGKKIVIKLKDVAILTEKESVLGIDPEKVKICKEVLVQIHNNLQE